MTAPGTVVISRMLFEEVQDFLDDHLDADCVDANKAMSLLRRLNDETEETEE